MEKQDKECNTVAATKTMTVRMNEYLNGQIFELAVEQLSEDFKVSIAHKRT